MTDATTRIKPADPHRPDNRQPPPELQEEKPTPGDQERPLTREEDLDNAVVETFPASDPISPSRIDGPNT